MSIQVEGVDIKIALSSLDSEVSMCFDVCILLRVLHIIKVGTQHRITGTYPASGISNFQQSLSSSAQLKLYKP